MSIYSGENMVEFKTSELELDKTKDRVTTQQISNGFLERWSVEKKRAQFVS
jgi:hypothetical protein